MGPLVVPGITAATASIAAMVTGAVTDADSVGATVARAAVDSTNAARRAMSPRLPTPEQLARWESKVGRPASKRAGIRIRPRVHTFPYLRARPGKLQEFAALASRALNISPAGGVLWAVKANVEGGFESQGTWNRNTGNVKLYRTLALADETPECWFLIDGVNSYDLYQSFGVGPNDSADQYLDDNQPAWMDAMRDAWARTFAQPHYQNSFATVNGQRKTFMECINAGLLQQVCAIMGGNGYAASYRSGSFMTARYNRMVRAGMIPQSLSIQPVGRVVGRNTANHNYVEVS